MPELEIIKEILQAGGGVGSIVILFLLWRAGIIKFKNSKNGQTSIYELTNQISKLEQHYNNDTTLLLGNINEGIKDVKKGQNEMCRKLDLIVQRQSEIIDYGVKVRGTS